MVPVSSFPGYQYDDVGVASFMCADDELVVVVEEELVVVVEVVVLLLVVVELVVPVLVVVVVVVTNSGHDNPNSSISIPSHECLEQQSHTSLDKKYSFVLVSSNIIKSG